MEKQMKPHQTALCFFVAVLGILSFWKPLHIIVPTAITLIAAATMLILIYIKFVKLRSIRKQFEHN